MTNHIKAAKNVCERLREGTLPCNEISELRAQTHAQIAIAEQLQLSNRINLGISCGEGVATTETDPSTGKEVRTVHFVYDSHIAELLGVEQEEES
jgi:hypothetical protein